MRRHYCILKYVSWLKQYELRRDICMNFSIFVDALPQTNIKKPVAKIALITCSHTFSQAPWHLSRYIASKYHYFGVGGGVESFKQYVDTCGIFNVDTVYSTDQSKCYYVMWNEFKLLSHFRQAVCYELFTVVTKPCKIHTVPMVLQQAPSKIGISCL